MDTSKEVIYLIGSGDPWVFELKDVASLLGYFTIDVTIEGFKVHKNYKANSDISVANVPVGAKRFLAFQPHPKFDSANFSAKFQKARQKLLSLKSTSDANWVTLIHPMSWVSPSTRIGKGVFIGANSSVGANSEIGNHSIINRNASIGHDVWIGEGVEVSPNSVIPSGVSVEKWASIGAGAVILNGLTIGEEAIVGAGSVVTKNVPPGYIVFGNPAKPKL